MCSGRSGIFSRSCFAKTAFVVRSHSVVCWISRDVSRFGRDRIVWKRMRFLFGIPVRSGFGPWWVVLVLGVVDFVRSVFGSRCSDWGGFPAWVLILKREASGWVGPCEMAVCTGHGVRFIGATGVRAGGYLFWPLKASGG